MLKKAENTWLNIKNMTNSITSTFLNSDFNDRQVKGHIFQNTHFPNQVAEATKEGVENRCRLADYTHVSTIWRLRRLVRNLTRLWWRRSASSGCLPHLRTLWLSWACSCHPSSPLSRSAYYWKQRGTKCIKHLFIYFLKPFNHSHSYECNLICCHMSSFSKTWISKWVNEHAKHIQSNTVRYTLLKAKTKKNIK